MSDLTLLIFLFVYVAMGFGKVPGFRVDRTGAAVVGALLMMTTGRISAKEAWEAIDYRTVGMLFGLMVVSSAFIASGFYAWVARWAVSLRVSPPVLLAILILVGAVLSSVLTNDVVVVTMTPLLVSITVSRGLNPVPFLLAFCFAANTASVGTIIGAPQNMIAAQGLEISFNGFLRIAILPALLSLPIVWGIIAFFYRKRWAVPTEARVTEPAEPIPPVNHWETAKAAVLTLGVVAAFVFSDWPRELVAFGAAAVLLINRRISSNDMLKHVDGNLLLLLIGLFIVNAALAATGLPERLLTDLRGFGFDLNQPLWLFVVTSVLSNVVGNNPAVMLLVPFLDPGAERDAIGAALAFGTGFSSNMVIFGSLAGIIVVEQAARAGVKISFKEFARAGIPVSIACMIMAAGWIAWLAAP